MIRKMTKTKTIGRRMIQVGGRAGTMIEIKIETDAGEMMTTAEMEGGTMTSAGEMATGEEIGTAKSVMTTSLHGMKFAVSVERQSLPIQGVSRAPRKNLRQKSSQKL